LHYTLRKTFGPLSAGTPVTVLRRDEHKWEKRGDTNLPGYATVRLANVSDELRSQIKNHLVYRQLLGAFDIEVDMIVRHR
jgi:hypothetical protein